MAISRFKKIINYLSGYSTIKVSNNKLSTDTGIECILKSPDIAVTNETTIIIWDTIYAYSIHHAQLMILDYLNSKEFKKHKECFLNNDEIKELISWCSENSMILSKKIIDTTTLHAAALMFISMWYKENKYINLKPLGRP